MEDKKEISPVSLGVKYGVFIEKLCTKLRRLSLIGAYNHKKEIGGLLKSTLDAQKEIKEDKNLDEATKSSLLLRTDTLSWFMGSMIEDIQEAEEIGKTEQPLQKEIEEDFDYLG